MRLLGEAYNYRLLTSGVVFDMLYLLLSFGHEDPDSLARLDPPTSYFRIRCARVKDYEPQASSPKPQTLRALRGIEGFGASRPPRSSVCVRCAWDSCARS